MNKKHYICRAVTELPGYMMVDIRVQEDMQIHAGQVFNAEELDDLLGLDNVKVYLPEYLSDVQTQVPVIVLNGSFETLQDKRRPNGNPDYTTYIYEYDDVLTAVRLIPETKFELSLDAIDNGNEVNDLGYLIPQNDSEYLHYVATEDEITSKVYLKIEAFKEFRLGGQSGMEFTKTLVVRVKNAMPIEEDGGMIITFKPETITQKAYPTEVVGTLSATGGKPPYRFSLNGRDSVNGVNNNHFIVEGNKVKVNSTPLNTNFYSLAFRVTDSENKSSVSHAKILVSAPYIYKGNYVKYKLNMEPKNYVNHLIKVYSSATSNQVPEDIHGIFNVDNSDGNVESGTKEIPFCGTSQFTYAPTFYQKIQEDGHNTLKVYAYYTEELLNLIRDKVFAGVMKFSGFVDNGWYEIKVDSAKNTVELLNKLTQMPELEYEVTNIKNLWDKEDAEFSHGEKMFDLFEAIEVNGHNPYKICKNQKITFKLNPKPTKYTEAMIDLFLNASSTNKGYIIDGSNGELLGTSTEFRTNVIPDVAMYSPYSNIVVGRDNYFYVNQAVVNLIKSNTPDRDTSWFTEEGWYSTIRVQKQDATEIEFKLVKDIPEITIENVTGIHVEDKDKTPIEIESCDISVFMDLFETIKVSEQLFTPYMQPMFTKNIADNTEIGRITDLNMYYEDWSIISEKLGSGDLHYALIDGDNNNKYFKIEPSNSICVVKSNAMITPELLLNNQPYVGNIIPAKIEIGLLDKKDKVINKTIMYAYINKR